MTHQRPEPDAYSSVAGWRCPLCNSTAHERVQVSRQGGALYTTEFFSCMGCSVMFRNPGRFTRLGMPVRRWAGDVEPRALREAHGFTVEPEPPKR